MKIKSLIFTVALSIALLFSVGLVSAQTPTIAQLQALIAQLIAQIQALQAQQSANSPLCYNFNNNLWINNSCSGTAANCEILKLQDILSVKEGSQDVYKDNANGSGGVAVFGENTAASVVKFQTKYGIIATGFVGPLTRAKLNSLYGCGTIRALPSVNVISPNGGEVWRAGETHNIAWQASAFKGQNVKVWITVVDYGNNEGGYPNKQYPISAPSLTATIIGFPIEQGSFNWTIPSNLITGSKIKIRIQSSSSVMGENVSSESANYLTIVTP